MLKGMTSTSLVGRWSADTLYSPGAASDEILNIRGDGTGRLDIWNWRLCEVIYFTWIADDGALTVAGERYFLLDDEERTVREHPWSWHWKAVPYSVEVSAAPLHPDGIEVLTIDHQTAGLDNRFGRLSSDVPSDMNKVQGPIAA
jgi:hypothetical protein